MNEYNRYFIHRAGQHYEGLRKLRTSTMNATRGFLENVARSREEILFPHAHGCG